MVEVADIFRDYGQEYRKQNNIPYHVHKVMNAIEACRTAALGGHVYQCEHCNHQKIAYNSCRNRHCPKCQGLAQEKWVLNRKKDLLPIDYYHVVFTIPAELNPLVLRNKKELYNIHFRACARTLMELAKDDKHLGAEIGFISILHTWGQNLMDHPHIHCIATGGGLSPKGYWIPSRKKFLLPIKVMSRLFKGKYLAFLKELYLQGKLLFTGVIDYLKKDFQGLLNILYKKEWIVYCKPPFSTVNQVFDYIGRYTHRVAISNHRIKKVENDKVTYSYRDYSDGNKNKLMTIDALEFIRRFLMHVLPQRFVKIRHYGLLSNRGRKTKLQRCKELILEMAQEQVSTIIEETSQDILLGYYQCPVCKKGKLIRKTKYNSRHGPFIKHLLIA